MDYQPSMKRAIWIVLPAFVLGFAIAWVGKPVNRALPAPPCDNLEPSNRSSARERRTGSLQPGLAMDRVKGYLRKIDEASAKRGFSSDLLKDVPTGDVPLLIEQWKKRAGFSGLNHDEQSQIRKLVQDWYEKEPLAALDWVAGMECGKDRQVLISEIVGAEAKLNFDHALELAKQYGKKELGGLEMPNEVRDKLGECDPARFMEIVRAFPSSGSGSGGSYVDFNENFDFAGLAELLKKADGANEDESFSFFPSNIVREWTKYDPEAAWNWISNEKSDSMPFNGADDFFETLATTRSPEQINAFLIDQMAVCKDDDSKFRLAWQALATEADSAQIADCLTRLPGERSLNLEKLAKAAMHGSGGKYDDFKDVLVAQMTVEERRVVLPKVFGGSDYGSNRKKLTQTLRQLGHTDAEIGVMLPSAKQE